MDKRLILLRKTVLSAYFDNEHSNGEEQSLTVTSAPTDCVETKKQQKLTDK